MKVSRIYKEDESYLPITIEEPEEISTGRKWMIRIMRILAYPFDELL